MERTVSVRHLTPISICRSGAATGIQGSARHFWEERVKDHVVLAVEQHDLAGVGRELPAQRLRAPDAAEPTADDDDSLDCGSHHGDALLEEPASQVRTRLPPGFAAETR